MLGPRDRSLLGLRAPQRSAVPTATERRVALGAPAQARMHCGAGAQGPLQLKGMRGTHSCGARQMGANRRLFSLVLSSALLTTSNNEQLGLDLDIGALTPCQFNLFGRKYRMNAQLREYS